MPDSIAFDSSKRSYTQKFSTIALKEHEEATLTGNFLTFRLFLWQTKAQFYQELHFPIKNPTGKRLQLLFTSFRVLLYENVENVTKVALEENVNKSKFCDFFGIIVEFLN